MSGKQNSNIEIPASVGLKAVLLSYAAPLIALLAGFFVPFSLGAGELFSGLCAIAAAALWFFVLWLLRARVRREYDCFIKNN